MKIVIWTFLVFWSGLTFSQDQIFFTQLTESYTNCILKDSDGFIWVGTQDGLLRYDYTKFKSYRHQTGNEHSLPNNWIWSIVEDKNEKLWIGTFGGGLVMWDKISERFYSFENNLDPTAESIHSLELYKDSLLLVGTEQGLYQFDISTKTFVELAFAKEEDDKFIHNIYTSMEEDVYVGTNESIYVRDSKADFFRKLELTDEPTMVHAISGIAHRIYIGTDKGLFIYNRRKRTIEHQLENYIVQSILTLGTDEWYLGTDSGIGHFTSESGYLWYTANSEEESSLKSDLVHSIYDVDDEMLWAGTRKGIHQFSIRPPYFKNLNDIYSKTLCSSTVLGMTEDLDKNIWICSRNGLQYLKIDKDLSISEIRCYLPSNQIGMQDAYTINISTAFDGSLWLSYRKNGFSKITKKNGKWYWENFPKINALLDGEGVNQVFQDYDGEMWLATRGKGLIKFNPETQETQTFSAEEGLSHPYVFRIFEDAQRNLWLSTANGGVCKFDKRTSSFSCFELDRNNPTSLSVNMVLSTNSYSDNRMIVSTVNGLNIMNSDSTFRLINTFDGIPDNVVYGALEDDNGFLWISTNEGISRIKLGEQSVQATNYSKVNGLASKEHNQHSFLEHSSGLFFFGGVEGVTYFDPLKVETEELKATMVLTDFQLFNNSVQIGLKDKEKYSLPSAINELDQIDLRYHQNSISFEFAALGPPATQRLRYMHIMDGLEKDWIVTEDRNFVSYPKLPSGSYVFRVKAMDQNGHILDAEKNIQINISRPPWATWWAYLVYILFVGIIIYTIINIQNERTKAIAKARESERSIFRKKMSRDFHDEAGNKITMISLLTDHVTRNTSDKQIVSTMEQLQDNIQELRSGMQDFIWVLDPAKDNLFDVLIRFRDFANDSFEYTDMDFKMDAIYPTLEDYEMPGNTRRHFLLIFKEAITNLLKYSEATHVKFNFRRINDHWKFELSDDGKGFDIDNVKRINGINNMKTRGEKIGSTIEIKTKTGEGTSVALLWK